MCALTVLGAFEVIIALASIGIGNWAVFAYPGHLRKTAAFNFWAGGTVCENTINSHFFLYRFNWGYDYHLDCKMPG